MFLNTRYDLNTDMRMVNMKLACNKNNFIIRFLYDITFI